MEEKKLSLFKNLEEFEQAIRDGFEIPIYNWIRIKSRKTFVDNIAKIDIYYGSYIEYSLDRLNEILYAVERKNIQQIIKERGSIWEGLKTGEMQINKG